MMVSKAYVDNAVHVRPAPMSPAYKRLDRKIEALQEELAEYILLESKPVAVSPYDMTYGEYMELSGNVRL